YESIRVPDASPSSTVVSGRRLRHDPQVGEVPFRAGADPEGDRALLVAELEVVDDERRLRRVVNVEPRLRARDHDLHPRPHAGLEVDIGLVRSRRFLTQALPRVLRLRDVLGRVIATELVVAAAVGRPEVEALEPLAVQAER